MNKKIYGSIIIFIGMILVGYTLYKKHQKHYFSCTAHYQVSHDNIYLRAMFRLVFNGDEGIAMLTGEVKDEQDRHLALNRQMRFVFSENNSNYILHSVVKIQESFDEVNDMLLSRLITSFYYEPNATVQYNIVKQSNGDYVVYDGKLPQAYCHNS
jgi:hypothetical protein